MLGRAPSQLRLDAPETGPDATKALDSGLVSGRASLGSRERAHTLSEVVTLNASVARASSRHESFEFLNASCLPLREERKWASRCVLYGEPILR